MLEARRAFVVTSEIDGQINYWSAEAAELLGWDEEEAIGLDIVRRLFPREYLVRGNGAFVTATNGGEWEGQIYARQRDGQDIPVLLKIAPVLDESGFPVGVLVAGQALPQKDLLSPEDLDRHYVAYLVQECNLSPLTAQTYLASERRIERFCGKRVERLTVDDVRRYMRESQHHPGTKNMTLVSVKSRHRWLVLEGYIDYNKVLAMRGPRVHRELKGSLSTQQARKLLDVCHRPNEFRVIYLGLLAGLRVSESARIGSEHGLWLEDRLRVLGKGRKWREVPVHPELEEHKDIILCRSTTAGTLKNVCESLSYYTGIEFTSHSLRHTFGVHLSEARVDRDVIGHLMGHGPRNVTVGVYVPVRWGEMKDAMARLSYDVVQEPDVLEEQLLEEGAVPIEDVTSPE